MTKDFEQAPRLWINIVLFVLTFAAAVTIVPWYGIVHGYGAAAWTSFAVLLAATGLSITAGYHRLWAHRTYEAHWTVRLFFMIFGTMALESSILTWASGHRIHHRFIDDNDRDPYSIKRGFWFAHMGWMLREYPSGVRDDSYVRDLYRDPLVVFQDRHYVPLVLATNLGIPVALGWLLGDVWGVFWLGGLLRLVVNHHVTFFINSLAHMWGSQPYSDDNTARDNGLLALLTYGEGYHNFHHRYASDYRNGVRWWQWDPSKWLIFSLSKLGLAGRLRRMPDVKIQHARLAMQFKRLEEKLANKQRLRPQVQLEQLRDRLTREYENLKTSVEQWRKAREEWFDTQREAFNKQTGETLAQMRLLRRRLRLLDTQIAAA